MRVLAAALCLFASAAQAQSMVQVPKCGGAEDMLSLLQKDFGEVVVAEMTSSGGVTIILTGHPTAQTWTLLVQVGAGLCILNVGDDLKITLPQPKENKI